MNPPPAADRAPSPSDQVDVEHLRVLGSLLASSPERVRAVVASLRQASRIVESTVHGTCMGESLPNGSTIRIQLEQAARYKPGEIVAVLDGTKLVVHRIVHVGRRGLGTDIVVTRSDAKLLPDPPCRVATILGRVIAVTARGRSPGQRQVPGVWAAPPKRPSGSIYREALASAIACAVAGLAHIHIGMAGRALNGLCRARNGLAHIARPFGARHVLPPAA